MVALILKVSLVQRWAQPISFNYHHAIPCINKKPSRLTGFLLCGIRISIVAVDLVRVSIKKD